MCEVTVYLKDRTGVNVVMRDAATVRSDGPRVVCTDLLGGSIVLEGAAVIEIDLLRHRAIVEGWDR